MYCIYYIKWESTSWPDITIKILSHGLIIINVKKSGIKPFWYDTVYNTIFKYLEGSASGSKKTN